MEDETAYGSVDPAVAERVAPYMEQFFVSHVEFGAIRVDQRSAGDIISDVVDRWLRIESEDNEDDEKMSELVLARDYRRNLYDAINYHARAKEFELATTLCAIFLEHSVNALLVKVLRRTGTPEALVNFLMRRLNWSDKLGDVWKALNIPAISRENSRVLNEIVELRNSFVHYKYLDADYTKRSQEREKMRRDVDTFEEVAKEIFSIQEQVLWNGRRAEVIAEFRSELQRVIGNLRGKGRSQ